MLAVYLDGIQLQADQVRFVMNVMGTMTDTCENCGGSVIEVKSIHLRSGEGPATLFTWCSTCGNFSKFKHDFLDSWYKKLDARVA